ncbi:MAG: ABC transporter substrate-binding subunit SaoX [Syntrophobacteraceae bacterium]
MRVADPRHSITGRFVLPALAFVMLLASVATVQAKGDDNYVVKLGYYDCDHMAAAPIARDSGIFEKLGVKVDIVKGDKVIQAIAAGQMDVGYGNFFSIMRASLKGSPAFVAAHNHVGGAYYLVVSNNIKSDPKELPGKKLALGTAPEKSSPWWFDYAKLNGIPVEGKGYETFQMNDRDEYLALKTGLLDGALMCDPYASKAEFEKCGRIMHTFIQLPSGEEGVCCVMSMRKAFVEEHPELAKKMILAHSQAIQLIYLHPLRAAEIFARNYDVPLEVGLMTIFKKTTLEGRTLAWDPHVPGFQRQAEHYVGIGYVEAMPNMKELVNTTIYDQARPEDFARFMKEKVDTVFPLGMPYDDWKKKAYEVEGEKL